ncbi:response regulator [Rhizobium sp. SAFR-030]|jgi:DNA-binding response OmpR family regulator|uniref:response regulator n=1 Tax=Rhizobium sp. SAFR-030 TaxID=3387277 RepID=UPI003F7D5B00
MSVPTLIGCRLLVVEDEYLVASSLLKALEKDGATVFGPVSDVERALEVVEASTFGFDAAILDVNLDGEMVYPVAATLSEQGIPFVFVTGYDLRVMPHDLAAAPCLMKPCDESELIRLLRGCVDDEPLQP